MSAIDNLVNQLSRLPGIGHKTAERLAYHIVDLDQNRVDEIIDALSKVKTDVVLCSKCQNLTSEDPCSICSNEARDSTTVLVVEYPKDVQAIEKAGKYKGLYHVLHGDIVSSEDGNLKVTNLLERIRDEDIREIILALAPDTSGEASIIYLSQLLEPLGIDVSRIAYGIPYGSDMEYFDSETINIAIDNRTKIDSK